LRTDRLSTIDTGLCAWTAEKKKFRRASAGGEWTTHCGEKSPQKESCQTLFPVLEHSSASGTKHAILTAEAEAIAANGPRVNLTIPAGQLCRGTTDLTRLESSAFFAMSCPFGQAEFAAESAEKSVRNGYCPRRSAGLEIQNQDGSPSSVKY
jgi:hypothetical protein